MDIKNLLVSSYIFPIFHVIFGAYLILAFLRIVKPFKEEKKFNSFKYIFLVFGILLFLDGIYGLFKIINN